MFVLRCREEPFALLIYQPLPTLRALVVLETAAIPTKKFLGWW